MDICNNNKLRITVSNDRRYWRTPPFMVGAYCSGDHGKPRLERNFFCGVFGRTLHVKWRPDGK